MPSDQERSEPTPAEGIEMALWNLDDTCLHAFAPGDCAAPHRVCHDCSKAILTRLVEATERAAKKEALRNVVDQASAAVSTHADTGYQECHSERCGFGCSDWDDGAEYVRRMLRDALSALESSGEAK